MRGFILIHKAPDNPSAPALVIGVVLEQRGQFAASFEAEVDRTELLPALETAYQSLAWRSGIHIAGNTRTCTLWEVPVGEGESIASLHGRWVGPAQFF